MASKRKSYGRAFSGHLRAVYRSGLEGVIAAALVAAGVEASYEAYAIPFTQPPKDRTYKPDFVLPNGIVIETKGIFELADRQKHEWVREQHPAIDIRFVFSNAKAKLTQGSPTTYAVWCDKRGFKWGHRVLPEAWLCEPPNAASLAALKSMKLHTKSA